MYRSKRIEFQKRHYIPQKRVSDSEKSFQGRKSIGKETGKIANFLTRLKRPLLINLLFV